MCASRTITKKNDTSIFKQEKEEKDIENINDNITPSEIDYSENEIKVSNYDSTTYKNNEVNENRDSLKENNEIQINYTQETLAEKLSLSPRYISQLERGIAFGSANTIVSLCKALNISTDFLFSDFIDSDSCE